MPFVTELLILDCNRVNGVSCNPDIVGASGDVWIKVVPVFAHFARCKTEFPRALNTTSVLPVMVGSSGQSPGARSKEKVRPILITYISSGSRIGSARGSATREATLRRGEPMQLRRAGATSIVGKDFLPAIALEEPVVGQGHGRLANCAMMEQCH